MEGWTAQLRKGLVELAVLAALRQSEQYGYELLQHLRTAEGLIVTESTLYPLLARLRRERCVRVRAAPSPAGPPRRYYRLTAAGHDRLRAMISQWHVIREQIDHLLQESQS